MSRDHDAPVEYLRILASLKLRFGLAALGTAHGTLPVGSPMVVWDTHLPNGCVGRQAFPMVALVVKHKSITHMVAGSGRLPTPHTLLVDFQHTGWCQSIHHSRRHYA